MKPSDLDFWLRYIHNEEEKPIKQEDDLWKNLTKNLDSINTHRGHYLTPETKKMPSSGPAAAHLPTPDKTVIQHIPSPIDVSQLNRQEKRLFKRTYSQNYLTLDLHGYTLKQAYTHLCRVVTNAYSQRIPMVKVITGRGSVSHSPERPTLRSVLPVWIKNQDLSPKVIKLRKAPIEHGGEGAFFLFIRKR